MEASCILDSDNRFGGKMSEERLLMRNSLGSGRKKLSDITNGRQQQQLSPIPDEKMKLISCSTKEYIEQLQKENMTLMRILAERNKIIELTGAELAKMRTNLQKLQQQNWHLAQANSQMLAELNLGKDRLRVMHHELGCASSLVAAKNLEIQEKLKKRPCQKCCTEDLTQKLEKVKVEATNDLGDCRTSKPNKKRPSRMQSSSLTPQVAAKENIEDKRHSAWNKSEQDETNNEKADSKREPVSEKVESKRLCLRRQSNRFCPDQGEASEDLFEIEDAKFPLGPLLDENMQECTTSSTKAKKKVQNALMPDTPAPRRSSVGRPMRRAAEKVQCYKEVPLNIKMRRSD